MTKLSESKYLSGDIGLTSGNWFTAKVIVLFTSWLTKNASKCHAWGAIDCMRLVEAVDKIRLNLISKYDSPKYTKVDVYRLPLSDEDRNAFKWGLVEQVNKAYGWSKLPLFALDAIATKIASLFGREKPIFFFTKTFGIFNIPVCSQLVVWALHKFTSYRLKDSQDNTVNWRVVSPDYLEDLLKIPANHAIRIYKKSD